MSTSLIPFGLSNTIFPDAPESDRAASALSPCRRSCKHCSPRKVFKRALRQARLSEASWTSLLGILLALKAESAAHDSQ